MRWLAILLVLAPRLAFAHQTSVKYVDIAIEDTRAEITFKVAPGDVTEPMHLPADGKPSAEEAAAAPDVAPFVVAWLAVKSWGEPCKASPPAAHADEDGKFVTITWTAHCVRAPDEADFMHFFAVDQRHAAIVHVASTETGELSTIVRANEPVLALRERPSLLAWINAGVHHIVDWDGRDHISFVLALLLVVMLARDGKDWRVRTFVPTLKSTATVITAFTIAHSLSLIAAALGWVHLPSRVVETLIATSIAYTAAENILKPDVTWRFVLTFGFGLVHGLGFASTLSAMLPPRDVIVPLLCFNVGVELGQLTIVLLALPVFFVLARELGAERYRRRVMPAISALIFVAGAVWVFQRI